MADLSELLKTVKRASLFDVFVISFAVTPFVMKAWVEVLSSLEVDECSKLWAIAGVFLLYIVGIIAMLVSNSRDKKCEVAKDQVIGYLQSKGFQLASFERIREKINSSYSDEFLQSLPNRFPQELRRATLKGSRLGLGRIVEESGDEA
jgi:hypothetical protein